MPVAFWDSSALVKLLVEEPGRDLAVDLWNESTEVVASRLAIPEVSAALAAASRAGRLDEVADRSARRELARYLRALDIIEMTAEVTGRAAALASRHVVSGADAVHLASVLSLGSPEALVATWDRRLAVAAVASGLDVVPGDV